MAVWQANFIKSSLSEFCVQVLYSSSLSDSSILVLSVQILYQSSLLVLSIAKPFHLQISSGYLQISFDQFVEGHLADSGLISLQY